MILKIGDHIWVFKPGDYVCEESHGICGTVVDSCGSGVTIEQEDGSGFSVQGADIRDKELVPILQRVVLNNHSPELAFKTAGVAKIIEATQD